LAGSWRFIWDGLSWCALTSTYPSTSVGEGRQLVAPGAFADPVLEVVFALGAYRT
jgi:hypothetical protein